VITILSAVLALGILIFVHELGHFLVARQLGVGVEKFSLGFGPKLVATQRGETEYRISAIPLGGYVKLAGENPDEECADPEKSFSLKPVWTRLAVVLAGPTFNLLFAAVLYVVVFMVGVPVMTTEISGVAPGSSAQQAGLQKGDRLLAVGDVQVREWDELADIIHKSAGKPLDFKVLRGDQEFQVRITPRADSVKNLFGEQILVGRIGIEASGKFITKRYNPLAAIGKGLERTWAIIMLTLQSIVKIISRVIPASTIGGPILIFQMAGETARMGIVSLIHFVALLSINLGILNLLPIPVLDGGHITFFVLEAIKGKPISLRKREVAQQVGLVLLISLMVFAFYNDLVRLFLGPAQ